MSGIKIYNANINGVRLSKGITVEQFKSWIVSTLGSSGNDRYYSVAQSSDGGYVAVGYQNSQGQGSYDALIVKYDSDLNVLVQKSLGSTNSDEYRSVVQSSDGGYVAAGSQNSQGQGSSDALIVKYDSNLNVVTQKSLGGSNHDTFYHVSQTSDGGYVATGYQSSVGSNGALIVKYDSDLNVLVQKSLGGTGTDYYQSVIQSNDGGYVAVGYQNSQGQGSNDALIVKYDSNLNLVSQKGFAGTGNDVYQSVIQSNDGGYVAAGSQNSQGQGFTEGMIVKYDSNLNVVTQKSLGGATGSTYYSSVIPSSDSGYVAIGYQYDQTEGNNDTLIVKYDSNLNLVSQKSLGGTGNDFYLGGSITNGGGFVAVGGQNSQGQGGIDALITKYPDNDDLLTGSLSNHAGMTWTTPTLSETTTTLTETAPTLSDITTTFTVTTTTLTETTPTLVETRSEKQ